MSMALKMNDMDKVSRTIHVGGVGGLGDEIKEADLAEFFIQYGEVTAVRISGRFAWVEFSDVRAANAALALDGETTGGHHLRVSQSKSAIHSNGLRKRSEQQENHYMDGQHAQVPSGEGLESLTPEQQLAALQNMQNIAAAGGAYDPNALAQLQAQVAATQQQQQHDHMQQHGGVLPAPYQHHQPYPQYNQPGMPPPPHMGAPGRGPPPGPPPGPPRGPGGYGPPPPYGGMPPPYGAPPPYGNPGFQGPPGGGYGPPQGYGGPPPGKPGMPPPQYGGPPMGGPPMGGPPGGYGGYGGPPQGYGGYR